jgi:hypothetical protein
MDFFHMHYFFIKDKEINVCKYFKYTYIQINYLLEYLVATHVDCTVGAREQTTGSARPQAIQTALISKTSPVWTFLNENSIYKARYEVKMKRTEQHKCEFYRVKGHNHQT